MDAQNEKGAPAADAAEAETVKLVNTGRGPLQVLPGPGGVLKPNSANMLDVPAALAAKLRNAYPHVKNAADIFPGAVDTSALKAENAALRQKAASLEGLLGLSDKAKAEAAAAFEAEKAEAVEDWGKQHDALKAENAALRAAADGAKTPPDVAALQTQVADLQGRLQEFLDAGSKKDLEQLQEKHADAVPAPAGA